MDSLSLLVALTCLVKMGGERWCVLKKVVTPVKTGVHVIPTHYGFSPNAVRIELPRENGGGKTARFKKSRHPRENGGPCHTNPLWIPAQCCSHRPALVKTAGE